MFKIGDIIQIQHINYYENVDKEDEEGELGAYYVGDIGIVTNTTIYSKNLKVTFLTNEREDYSIKKYEARLL